VLLIPLGLCLGFGLCLMLALGRVRPPPAALTELSRTNLVRLDGRWCQIGHTNPFTGVLLEFYPDGVLRSRSTVSNGWLNGLSEGWYTNRQLEVRESYRTNFSDGPRTKWYPDGRRLSEATIVRGKMEGIFRRWYENGKLAEEIPMRDGKIEGVGRTYYESGFLKTELTISDGKVTQARNWPDGKQSPE
jgi:antitoxin component YwqK of YwqJK toxin-antitoxin module